MSAMKIKSIREFGTGKVRNITVKKNHTFLTKNGIVTHNCDAGSPTSMFPLHSILEGKPYYFRLKNEMIHPKEGFAVIALGNTLGKGDDSGRYIGTNIMNDALLERFALALHQTYPDQKTEKKIVIKLMGSLGLEANDKFINDITKWTSAIRITFEAGGIDEIISTRRLTHIIKAYAVFGNINKAVELGCNRFDEMTRAAFVDLFDKISGEDETSQSEEAMDPIDQKALNDLIENS